MVSAVNKVALSHNYYCNTKPVRFLTAHYRLVTPTFKTEAFHLVSNVQLFKCRITVKNTILPSFPLAGIHDVSCY